MDLRLGQLWGSKFTCDIQLWFPLWSCVGIRMCCVGHVLCYGFAVCVSLLMLMCWFEWVGGFEVGTVMCIHVCG